MATEAKTWQHGFSLDALKSIEAEYEPYNKFSHSPFSRIKKNDIAQMLHDKTLKRVYDGTHTNGFCGWINEEESKVGNPIKMFPDVVIAKKQAGDRVYSHMLIRPGMEKDMKRHIGEISYSKDEWFYIWEEDEFSKQFITNLGFKKIGTKFTSFSDIVGVYFRERVSQLINVKRKFPIISKYEYVTVNQLKLKKYNINEWVKRLDIVNWANHYSNYNVKDAWGAVALQGYSKDPYVIEKPVEMNDKWHEKNKDKEFKLQKTPFYKHFKDILDPILEILPGKKDRIRLMRLRANNEKNAELGRHTDQVGGCHGFHDGQLIRIHLPIITNPDVHFMCWNHHGKCNDINPKAGEFFVLDVRKPHRVVNNGTTDRIHLVIDVFANDQLAEMIQC
jgi:hypothetical protein